MRLKFRILALALTAGLCVGPGPLRESFGAGPLETVRVRYWAPTLWGLTGISSAAVYSIVALDQAGIQVEPISMTPTWDNEHREQFQAFEWSRVLGGEVDDRLQTLLQWRPEEGNGTTICIMHGNPHEWVMSGGLLRSLDDPSCDYRIGRMVLEVDHLPPQFRIFFRQFDEVWTSSAMHQRLLRRHGIARPFVVPEAVALPPAPETEPGRCRRCGAMGAGSGGEKTPACQRRDEIRQALLKRLGLPGDSVLFVSVGALTSRKSSQALVRAFAAEFPASAVPTPGRGALSLEGRPAYLLLKFHGSPTLDGSNGTEADRTRLAQLRGDLPGNILIYEGLHHPFVLPSDEYQSLILAADAFVLATRAEGYCRPCAEAMGLGTPTCVTGWGGHMDFMNEDNSLLLPFRLVPVSPMVWTKEPWLRQHEMTSWAEVDRAQLRLLLRWIHASSADPCALRPSPLTASPTSLGALSAQGAADIQQGLNLDSVGERMRDLIERIVMANPGAGLLEPAAARARSRERIRARQETDALVQAYRAWAAAVNGHKDAIRANLPGMEGGSPDVMETDGAADSTQCTMPTPAGCAVAGGRRRVESLIGQHFLEALKAIPADCFELEAQIRSDYGAWLAFAGINLEALDQLQQALGAAPDADSVFHSRVQTLLDAVVQRASVQGGERAGPKNLAREAAFEGRVGEDPKTVGHKVLAGESHGLWDVLSRAFPHMFPVEAAE